MQTERTARLNWRILQDEVVPSGITNPAVWNMERDARLLEDAITNAAPPALRLYQWDTPAITIGRFQNAERTICLKACDEEQVPVARRTTGGRGILHGDDLTIGIAASVKDAGLSNSSSVIEIYRHFAAGFIRAFHAVGIVASLGVCDRERAGEVRGDCFATISRADVVETYSGCKLLGAALYRKQEWILLQASIPLYHEKERIHSLASRLFRGPPPVLPQAAAEQIDAVKLKNALVQGFSGGLQVSVY